MPHCRTFIPAFQASVHPMLPAPVSNAGSRGMGNSVRARRNVDDTLQAELPRIER
ncbi:MAG: hypothetical protein ACK5SI_03060 [Planctomycetia bacterium]|jgi:hypothetical protein